MARIRIEFQGTYRDVPLTGEVVVFGRGDDCTVVLDDKQCSRKHCQIERAEGKYKLVDLESRNGTKVNGAFVNQRVLLNGDVAEVGTARVTFLTDAGEETDAAPGGGPPPPPPQAAAPRPPAKPTTAAMRTPAMSAHRTPAAFRSPVARRPRSNSAALGAIIVFALFAVVGGLAFFGSRKDPLQEQASRHWSEARELISKKKFAEALKELKQVTPDMGDAYERAKAKIEELEKTIEAEKHLREEAEQSDRFEEIRKFAAQSPDRKEELQRKIDFFRKDYPASKWQKDLEGLAAGETKPPPIAIGPTGNPGPNGNGGHTPAGTTDDAFKVIETSVNQLVAGDHFGAALHALDEFIKKNPSSADAKKAQEWHGKILDDAELFFTSKDEAARKLIKERKYAEAKVIYESIVKSFGDENSLIERALKAQNEIARINELETQK